MGPCGPHRAGERPCPIVPQNNKNPQHQPRRTALLRVSALSILRFISCIRFTCHSCSCSSYEPSPLGSRRESGVFLLLRCSSSRKSLICSPLQPNWRSSPGARSTDQPRSWQCIEGMQNERDHGFYESTQGGSCFRLVLGQRDRAWVGLPRKRHSGVKKGFRCHQPA